MTFRFTVPVRSLLALVLLVSPQLRARSITERDRTHWAFQPLKRIQPLQNPNTKVHNPIDQFVLARLMTNGLELAPGAGKEQLIRRVSFGLIGLPPTPEDIDAFANDSSP